MRALKAGWKRLQRLAYPAAVLTLVHWLFIHNNRWVALAHFAPLAALELWRLSRRLTPRKGLST
jgi:sulfoxide reductase heme-binding subunit YedZ